jgi:hypothetical protein
MTTLILILAANTSFADFPRLSSFMSRDRFMPRQFANRRNRLAFSNGIIILAVLSARLFRRGVVVTDVPCHLSH